MTDVMIVGKVCILNDHIHTHSTRYNDVLRFYGQVLTVGYESNSDDCKFYVVFKDLSNTIIMIYCYEIYHD